MNKKTNTLALLSSFLLWLAWPPIPYTGPVLLFALVPLLLAVDQIAQSATSHKGRQILGLCFAAFAAWNTASIYWVYNSLASAMAAPLAVLISLIPFGLGALLMTLAFWAYYQSQKLFSRFWSYLALISFWITYEWLHQSWDLAFPWMNLGNGFAQTHQLVQWYEFTGIYGGTLWILVSNILLFEIIRTKIGPVRWFSRSVYIYMAWVIVPLSYSLYRYYNYEERINPANVVVVQPNIDPYAKYGSMPASVQLQQLIHLSDSLGQNNTEFFIWPETAIPELTDEEQIRTNANFVSVQQFLNKYKNGNVLSGIESYRLYQSRLTATAKFDENSRLYYDSFNAAIQIENSAQVSFYHKSKLVPGVEQLPFASALAFMKPAFAAFGGSTGGYGQQEKPSVFYAQSGLGVSPVICYESIWGNYVAESVKQGASFIAIMTNDAWWGNTSGKDQHLAYAKLRAIENRRWVTRSANTGISAFINQRGDVVQQSQWWVPAALKTDINLNEETTFYTQHGDILASVGVLGALAFLLFAMFLFIRKRFTINK
ncbi:MAG: apolipoprotein N-acyltransferase [Sphingobacteriaceae bacterium]